MRNIAYNHRKRIQVSSGPGMYNSANLREVCLDNVDILEDIMTNNIRCLLNEVCGFDVCPCVLLQAFLQQLKRIFKNKYIYRYIPSNAEIKIDCNYSIGAQLLQNDLLLEDFCRNQGRFCKNSEQETLISKRLSVENKAKLSRLEIVNKTAEEVF